MSEDYYEDGLLMCGKCHTKKQTRVTLFGNERIVDCLCHCAAQERDKRVAEEKERKRLDFLEQRRIYAFSGGKTKAEIMESKPAMSGCTRLSAWRFSMHDGSNMDQRRKAENYVKHFEEFRSRGRGILMYGPTGTGKTFLGCCMVNALIDAGYSAIVTNFSQLSNELLGTWEKQVIMDRLMNCSVLMLDDLDIERDTGYMNELVYSVIDGRYRAGKPMIVTTNLSTDKLKNPSSIDKQRVYSRLMDVCIPMVFSGEDRRYAKAKSEYAKDLELLNER